MATFKFYNIQLLPMDRKKDSEVGVTGYCQLFKSVEKQLEGLREEKQKLSSISAKLIGDMFFSTFSASTYSYPAEEGKQYLIHGYFLKFDDVNTLVDTESGKVSYTSPGNNSSRRFQFEYVFDPNLHILAIQDARGLPTRNALIRSLNEVLGYHAIKLFPNHSLEIIELTSAESIRDFFLAPKKGYKTYKGEVTFSNSDDFDFDAEDELRELAGELESELKTNEVHRWETEYRSFKDSLMNDLPKNAKAQLILAAKFGNAEVSYKDEHNELKKYKMEDYPVKERLQESGAAQGIKNRALDIKNLITLANRKAKKALKAIRVNRNIFNKDE
ncbi:DUF4747 family protein [Providencia rettgeri]|nr:DUF4747 family protein [Providencia stuartii]ELR5081595.1 DUF4747 family protein [Providencia stuartii]MCL0015887.1 DUF4747 family protein [Providencia rettgeri]